jgi:hypothetical protein
MAKREYHAGIRSQMEMVTPEGQHLNATPTQLPKGQPGVLPRAGSKRPKKAWAFAEELHITTSAARRKNKEEP